MQNGRESIIIMLVFSDMDICFQNLMKDFSVQLIVENECVTEQSKHV